MQFAESISVAFKEITPNYNIPEKWKEIVLNTGGTHSTLQDIKFPQKAGGYWYDDSNKASTRNRFIYWQTLQDSIELSEASLDMNLTSPNLRCKVAAGTPPLNGMSVYERPSTCQVVILAATVSSVHRLIFPHPEVLDKKATFGSVTSSSPSIFSDTSAVSNPANYYILNQYSNATSGVAHTCATLLRDNGEAVFALAFGQSGEGGLLLVKLPVTGPAVTFSLRRESTVPRFLSGITGALRGKSNIDSIETYGVTLTRSLAVGVCGDTCLRAWSLDEGGAPLAVSAPLADNQATKPHGHMLQKVTAPNGSVLLVAYLSFANECEFVVLKLQDGGAGAVKFSHICRIFGPELDLLDFTIGYGDGSNVIWALWSQSDGETVITCSAIGAEVNWRAVAAREAPPDLPVLSSHHQYRDYLLTPGLFPHKIIAKALRMYRITWGGGTTEGAGEDLGDACVSAVAARLQLLAPRPLALYVHKCWSDLYSWCLQYMEGLQKPLGLMVSNHSSDSEGGWWCGVVRRAGISLVRELEPLERIMLAPDDALQENNFGGAGALCEMSREAVRVVAAAAAWEAFVPRGEHALWGGSQPPTDQSLTPQQIDELSCILEPIKDLQNAVLELNDALRLDVPEIDTSKSDDEDTSEYENLFASDLGVALVTEAIKQMADMRRRVVVGAVAALCSVRGAGGVPGAGHCAVHWQAYNALGGLQRAHLVVDHTHRNSSTSEAFRLKLTVLGATPVEGVSSGALSVAGAYTAGAGGRRARTHLAHARTPVHWYQALPLMAYHLAHQMWAVSGGFDFSWWVARVNQPGLVRAHVAALEPWCEWHACSRQFILGLALLDMDDAEGAYTAFSKAAKGVTNEPFLRQLVAPSDARLTQHQALVLYYMKVIKLFEIHDAGACVVRVAETAISIADSDDPNLPMFQWVVFKWHLSRGHTERALAAAAANPAPSARQAQAATLLTTLASRKELGALVNCGALAAGAERAATERARLHDPHTYNPYYEFLYALHVSRHHYRLAANILYERATRCLEERDAEVVRRRFLAASLTCLSLATPQDAFLVTATGKVIGVEELTAELKEGDPGAMDPVQQALLTSDKINFDALYPHLKNADRDTLSAVTRRCITTAQFLPRWFLLRYIEVDGGNCIRTLLAGGRVLEAGAAGVDVLLEVTRRLTLNSAPAAAPLPALHAVLAELRHQREPHYTQMYAELNQLMNEYKQLVVRTSEDMKMAQIRYPVTN